MRRFIASPTAPGPTAPPNPAIRLRIVSYNLLAERYTRDGQVDYASPKSCLDGAERTRRALLELEAYDPDLCALQELQRDVYEGPLADWMRRRGYSGAWVAKTRRLRGQARESAAARATALATGGGGSGSSDSGDSGGGSASDGGGDPTADTAAAADGAPDPAAAAEDDNDEGVALLWRDSALELVEEAAAFRFADAAPASRLLSEFGDAAVCATLRPRQGAAGAGLRASAFVAASVHLFWDPALAAVKARQAALLARRCASLARRHAGEGGGGGGVEMLPVVIAGDWNSMPPPELSTTARDDKEEGLLASSQEAAAHRAEAAAAAATHPGSGVYRLLTTGTLPRTHPDHPAAAAAAAAAAEAGEGGGGNGGNGARHCRRHHRALSTRGLKLATARAAAHGGREPELTTRTATFSGALDHIFISRRPSGSGGDRQPPSAPVWRVAATLEMPELAGPIPDERWPSDHLAVGADLELV